MTSKIHHLAFLLCLLCATSHAASVSAVKGKKLLINLEGDSVEAGDEFYLLNPDTQKKTAVIRIIQTKEGKALAELLKGRANSGYSLQAKGASRMSSDVTPADPSTTTAAGGYLRNLKDSWGIQGGYLMNSMQAEISYRDAYGASQKSSASMSGGGFGAGAFYDYLLTSSLVGRGYAAIEQFNVAGSATAEACAGSTNCDAKINYLSLYGLVKWYPLQNKYRVWLGGGMGYLLALSKSATALNESQISTNQVFTLGGGLDVQMNRKTYLPISLEYNLFPASDTVKASTISIKAGWAWNL